MLWHAVPFLRKGLRCLRQNKIKVELLDAVSIGLSIIRRDFATAMVTSRVMVLPVPTAFPPEIDWTVPVSVSKEPSSVT